MQSPSFMAPLVEQRDTAALPDGTAVCLGAFDGLHLGHQALLAVAKAQAPHVGLVTFDPHPQQVLAPERAPRLLQTPVQRRRVSAALGVEHLVLLPFDRAMAQMSPEQFVQQVLLDGLRPAAVVVGEDFRFGRGREGDGEELARRLAPAGIAVHRVAAVPVPPQAREPGSTPEPGFEGKLGTTTVRLAVEAGRVERAGAMLGRWYAVAGTVVEGAKRGRTIGFPTANIDAPDGFLPAPGVYAGVLAVWSEAGPHAGRAWPAVANLGRNPTFEATGVPLRLEAHAIDRALGESLYGLEVELSFVARLRDEQRFAGPTELVEQIRRDVEAARPHLSPQALAFAITPP